MSLEAIKKFVYMRGKWHELIEEAVVEVLKLNKITYWDEDKIETNAQGMHLPVALLTITAEIFVALSIRGAITLHIPQQHGTLFTAPSELVLYTIVGLRGKVQDEHNKQLLTLALCHVATDTSPTTTQLPLYVVEGLTMMLEQYEILDEMTELIDKWNSLIARHNSELDTDD